MSQNWTISLLSPLPAIIQSVTIDGYSQALTGVPFRYPSQITSAQQTIAVTGILTGGTFTLSTDGLPLPPGTTGPIAYNATPAQVQAALDTISGLGGNIAVTGSPGFYNVAFQGAFAGQPIPNLVGNWSGLIGVNPGVSVGTLVQGGSAISDPTMITSVPNTAVVVDGNNAKVRVIIDGRQIVSLSPKPGFELDASNCRVDGLIIEGFSGWHLRARPHLHGQRH